MEPMTKTPTTEELESMLLQCEADPNGNVWNWKVAELLRHYLKLRNKAKKDA